MVGVFPKENTTKKNPSPIRKEETGAPWRSTVDRKTGKSKKEKAPSLNSKRSSQTNKCSITYLQRTWYSKKIITKRDREMVKTKESLLFKSPLQVNVFPSPILQWQNWKKKRRDMRENKLPWSCKHAVDPTPASQTLCCQLHYL